MKKRVLTISIIVCMIIAAVIGVRAIQKYMFQAQMSAKYQVMTFDSEDEMLDTISGSWEQIYHLSKGNSELYLNFDNHICSKWSYHYENGTSSVETKNYTLDYQNGRIVFDNGYYYDIVVYEEKTYVRITPEATKEESYSLFERSNKSVPE